MKLLSKITHIVRYYIALNHLTIIFIDNNLNLKLYSNNKINLLSNNKFNGLFDVNGDIWCFDQTLLKTLVYQSVDQTMFYLDFVAIPVEDHRKNKKNTRIFRIREKDERFFGLLNNDTKEIEKRYTASFGFNSTLQLYENETFLSWSREELGLFNLLNGSVIWSLKYKEISSQSNADQYGPIVYHNEIIYFCISYDDTSRQSQVATFAINANTGKVLHRINGFGGDMMLCNNKLYSASWEYVWILDTVTHDFVKLNLEDELKPHNLRISMGLSIVTEEELLYFIDGHAFTTNRFGVIDLNKQKLLWHSSVEVNDGINNNIKSIKVHEDKLYVHTSDNSLHIFE